MKIAMAIASTYVFEGLEMDEMSKIKVRLNARKAGFFAWLASKLFKRTSGMTFEVMADGVVYDDGWRQWIPIKKISNVDGGYYMNTLLQALAVIALIAGLFTIFSGGLLLLIVAAILFYFYARSRRFLVCITADSGENVVFGIKRSVVGGNLLNDEDAWKMLNIVKFLVLPALGNAEIRLGEPQ